MSIAAGEPAPPPRVGRYVTPDDTPYRVLAVPGRAAMVFTERRNGRWRVVPELPASALARPGDVPAAFAEVGPVTEALTMRDWLSLLEAQRDAVKAGLLGLLHDHDAERVFSHDDFDLEYDADVAAASEAARPVLVALEDAIDLVRRCVERPRGGARLRIEADAIVGETVAAFEATWPGLRLDVFEPSDDYYKEGLPDHRDPALPMSRLQAPTPVELRGEMRDRDVRNAIFAAFEVETQVSTGGAGETLDEAVVREHQR